jgi:hypothetical protein
MQSEDQGNDIMSEATPIDNYVDSVRQATPVLGIAALKPKGACWYCNQPLDNVRKFCSKTCADDYRTEEEVFRDVAE